MAMNPILALLLALSMLVSPMAGYDTSLVSELPPFTVSVNTSDGLSANAGVNETTTGLPVIYFDVNGAGLTMTSENGYLADGTGTYAVPAADLANLLASMVQTIPEPTQEDLEAIMIFVQGVMGSISRDSFNLSMMGSGMSFTFDVDKLCDELHEAVPAVLQAYASYFDPTLAKYSAPLLGQVITSADLAAMWPQLGLNEISTGLAAQLTVLQSGNQITVIGSISEVNFIATITESSFKLDVTTPDSVTYTLDTADIPVVMNILSSLPSSITASAFNVNEISSVNENGYRVQTTTITLDTTALANDLNRGLAYAIAMNSASVNTLLDKYRSWIALVDADLAGRLTAETLMQTFNGGYIKLPAATGKLVVVNDQQTYTTSVDGSFAGIKLTGKLYQRTGNGSFMLSYDDRYEPLMLTLDICSDSYTTQFTFNSSVAVFDLFRTLTLSVTDSYDLEWHLTTDTNVLRIGYSDEEQYMEAKLGPVNAMFHMDENDMAHLEFYAPEFFVDLHMGEENGINLDSSLGGFDFAQTRYGWQLNGYLIDHYRYRTTFGATFSDNYRSQALSAYLNTSSGESYAVNYAGNTVSLNLNDQVYNIQPLNTGRNDQFGITLSNPALVNPVIATLLLTSTETVLTAELYQGNDLTVTPYLTLQLDIAPEAKVLPEATVVDVETFLTKLSQLF